MMVKQKIATSNSSCVSVLDGGIELDRLQGGKSLPICTLSSVCRG